MSLARSPLILSAVPAGLGLGALAWFALGGALAPVELAQLSDRVANVSPLLSLRPDVASQGGAFVLARPLFDTASATTPADPNMALQGLSLGAGHQAALITIGGAPPVWVAVGESRSGVTLRRVDASSALVETFSGDRSIRFGAIAAPSPTGVAAAPTPPVTR